MKGLAYALIYIDCSLIELEDHSELLQDFYSVNYYDLFYKYLKKFSIDSFELVEDKTYYKNVFGFCVYDLNRKTLNDIEYFILRFKNMIYRKYHIKAVKDFYISVLERSEKFKLGSERDYFIEKCLALYTKKLIRID